MTRGKDYLLLVTLKRQASITEQPINHTLIELPVRELPLFSIVKSKSRQHQSFDIVNRYAYPSILIHK